MQALQGQCFVFWFSTLYIYFFAHQQTFPVLCQASLRMLGIHRKNRPNVTLKEALVTKPHLHQGTSFFPGMGRGTVGGGNPRPGSPNLSEQGRIHFGSTHASPHISCGTLDVQAVAVIEVAACGVGPFTRTSDPRTTSQN